MKALISVVLGVVIGLGLVAPVQAQKLAMALCSNEAEAVTANLNGWASAQEIVEVTSLRTLMGYRCDMAYVGGFLLDQTGFNVIIVVGATETYILTYDLFGGLTDLR